MSHVNAVVCGQQVILLRVWDRHGCEDVGVGLPGVVEDVGLKGRLGSNWAVQVWRTSVLRRMRRALIF